MTPEVPLSVAAVGEDGGFVRHAVVQDAAALPPGHSRIVFRLWIDGRWRVTRTIVAPFVPTMDTRFRVGAFTRTARFVTFNPTANAWEVDLHIGDAPGAPSVEDLVRAGWTIPEGPRVEGV